MEFDGVNSTDRLYMGDVKLTGGLRDGASDSAWYYDRTGLIRYAVTNDNSLVIESGSSLLSKYEARHGYTAIDPLTYVTNFQNTDFSGSQVTTLGTAGITLGTVFAASGWLLSPELQKWMQEHKASIEGTFTSLTGAVSKAWTGQTWGGVDPLAFDFSGNGLALSTLDVGASARFDINGDGFANPSAWTSSSEGLLVKLNADGTVTSGAQFVGSNLVDGFAELASWDVNGDGKIDDSDLNDPRNAGRPQLRVWVDSNYDHQAQADELLTLDQAGITSITLANTKLPAGTLVDGSQVLSQGSFTLADGSTKSVSDVLLKTDNFNSTFLGDKGVTAQAAALPDLAGHGTLSDLSVALSLDEKAKVASGTLAQGAASALEQAVAAATAAIPLTPDITAWRQAALPILTAWTAAFADTKDGNAPRWWTDLRGADGAPAQGGAEYVYEVVRTNPDGSTTTTDQLQRQADGSWALASGAPITDASSNVISGATLVQALATPLGAGLGFQSELAQYDVVQAGANGSQVVDHLRFHYNTAAVTTLGANGQPVASNQMVGGWAFDSGRPVLDANGAVIASPTLDQALASSLPAGESWSVSAARPDFYTISATGASGTSQVVDALQYATSTVQVVETDPVTGQPVTVARTTGSWTFASGRPVTDAQGNVIAHPTLDQALATPLATNETWGSIPGGELSFMERYDGELLPFGQAVENGAAVLATLPALLDSLNATLDLIALRLAVQGPLKDTIFAGIKYDAASDGFVATTDRGIAPVYQAVFASEAGLAATDPAAALTGLTAWSKVLERVVSDFNRGGTDVQVTASYLFANIVAGYEASGIDLSLTDVAGAMGIDTANLHVASGSGPVEGQGDHNLFYIGPGNATYQAHDATDVYVVGARFGNSVIDDVDDPFKEQDNLLRFASLRSTDVSVARVGEDLVITGIASGDTLRVVGEFTYFEQASGFVSGNVLPQHGVDSITFADGVTWDRSDLSLQTAPENTHDQVLRGTDGDEVLVGGANDTLIGGTGKVTYIYDRGMGSDTIDTQNGNALVARYDVLAFGAGLTESDLQFLQTAGSPDLTIKVKGTDDTILVKNQFARSYAFFFDPGYLNRVDNFVFADGTSISADALMVKILGEEESSGQTSIYGFTTADYIDPGKGDHFINGGNGNDTFKYDAGYGNDTILPGHDNFLAGMSDELDFGPGITPDMLSIDRPAGTDDLMLTLSTGGSVLIQGQFTANDNVFGTFYFNQIPKITFADGTVWTPNMEEDRLLAQESAQVGGIIYGFFRDDTIVAGLGDKYLDGGSGNDTYVYAKGDGNDTIQDDDNGGGNTLVLSDISASDVQLSTSGIDLEIDIASTGRTITVISEFFGSFINFSMGVDHIDFADGSSLTRSDIEHMLIAQQEAVTNGPVYGFAGDDVLSAGPDEKYLDGGWGDDTYVFAKADGNTTINNFTASSDTLQLTDLSPADVAFGIGPKGDITMTVLSTGKVVTLLDEFLTVSSGVSIVAFADGTTWTKQGISNAIIAQESTQVGGSVFGFRYDDQISAGLVINT